MARHRYGNQPKTWAIQTAADLQRATLALGNSFFSRKTMRWWNSRIEAVYGTPAGAVYVTSEPDDSEPEGTRHYTIGVFDGKTTSTVEVKQPSRARGGPGFNPPGFQAFARLEPAKRYAKALAERFRRA